MGQADGRIEGWPMRIISPDGRIDENYDNCIVNIGGIKEKKYFILFVGSIRGYYLTEEECLNVMEDMREQHTQTIIDFNSIDYATIRGRYCGNISMYFFMPPNTYIKEVTDEMV
jgi:hypothetical protein